jgi:hypothetical protein
MIILLGRASAADGDMVGSGTVAAELGGLSSIIAVSRGRSSTPSFAGTRARVQQRIWTNTAVMTGVE